MMFVFNDWEEQSHETHVLIDSCYLCARPFYDHSDIFMYRGNKAFCSEDCRQDQIEFDEAKEQERRKKSMRKSDSDRSSPTNDVRSGSIQVA